MADALPDNHFLWLWGPRVRGGDIEQAQSSTNAFSITKWPGVLPLPSMKLRASNICFSSSSIAGLPHIMMRSAAMSSGPWCKSVKSWLDVMRSVMRPRLRKGSRVTVG